MNDKKLVNDYGYFSDNGEKFVVVEPNIPRHWYNYMWNDTYNSFTSQVGFGQSLAQDDMGRRVNLIENRNVFVLDNESKEWWTANGLPIQKKLIDYSCTHGIGYSEINLEYNGIITSFRIFVPTEGNFEIWTVKVKNNRADDCSIKVIPYFKTDIDGAYKPQGYNTGTGGFVSELNSVVGKSYASLGSSEIEEIFGFLTSSNKVTGFDSRKNAFIGTYGEELSPSAVEIGGCQNSECIAEKLCFALETTMNLKSGEESELNFIAGIAKTHDEIDEIRQKLFADNNIEAEFNKVLDLYAKQIDGVFINTPDENLNNLYNYWLKYETCMGSRWARVRHNGYRDLTSDCECLGSFNPDLAWDRLKRVLTYQYSNGYAPRTFINGSINDNNFADNTVWITFAVYTLLKERGDLKMLDELVNFNDNTSASVYEHIKRSVDFLWNFKGLHGLVKVWGGDWNDGLNFAGIEGKGVSVWLSIAWYRANKQFAEIARMVGKNQDADIADERGREMQLLIDKYGWDGEYYVATYTDDGTVLGSHECDEGKIFILPQLWAVLSGVSIDGKEKIAMEAVDKYLNTPLGSLVSWPPYSKFYSNIGYMTGKPAGVHENGGVYLHPSAWKIAVECMLKRNDKVEEDLEKILPFNHKWGEKKCEPYVLCNSYFPEINGYRYGTAGQSWRTASGAWLAKSLEQFVFGIQPEVEGLKLNPCLPTSWRTCSIKKKFRGAVYTITYNQVNDGPCNKILEIKVNGEVYNEDILPYNKNENYEVEVKLG